MTEKFDGDVYKGVNDRKAVVQSYNIADLNVHGGSVDLGGKLGSQIATASSKDVDTGLSDLGAALRIALASNLIAESDLIDAEIIEAEIASSLENDPGPDKKRTLLVRISETVQSLIATAADESTKTFFSAVGTYLAVKYGLD